MHSLLNVERIDIVWSNYRSSPHNHRSLWTSEDHRLCRQWYWWPRLQVDVEKFCASCEVCAQSKGEYQAPAGKLHPLPIPTRPWESIGMDFIDPFPEVDGYNYLWVVICCPNFYGTLGASEHHNHSIPAVGHLYVRDHASARSTIVDRIRSRC